MEDGWILNYFRSVIFVTCRIGYVLFLKETLPKFL